MEEDLSSSGGEEEQQQFRGRSRSRSLYGEQPVEPPSPASMSTSPPPPPSRRRSHSLRGGDNNGSSGPESPHAQPSPQGQAGQGPPGPVMVRRRSSGKLSGRGGLSKKTLNIVNNLQNQTPPTSKKDKEEEAEERKLALEEKRRQALGAAMMGVNKEIDSDYQIRILLLGDSGVGKTSLMHRYSEDEFAPNLLSTAGVDFKVRHITLDGKKIKCQVWDTAGQERFHVITRTYYKGAHGIALIYDVTDADSFKNVNYWMTNITQQADEKVLKVLLGNKTDLPGRQIAEEQGRNVAKEYNISFFETSAKDGTNVKEGFNTLAMEIVRRMEAQAAQSAAEAAAATAAGGGGKLPGGKSKSNNNSGNNLHQAATASLMAAGKDKDKCIIS